MASGVIPRAEKDAVAITDADRMVEEGEALLGARRLDEAIDVLRRAEIAGADANRCAGARWHCWMLLGEMERAWRESDAIRARGVPDSNRFWDGSDPAGKRVMVRSLHGFGDAVQNLRFLPELRRRARHVTLEIAPELKELAAYAEGADEVVTWGEGAPATSPVYDVQVEITELPYLLRRERSTIGAGERYLKLPNTLIAGYARSMPEKTRPRVGLVWNSSQWDTSRSIALEMFAPLLEQDAVSFWSFQTAADNGPWRQVCLDRGWTARASGEGSVVNTALALTQMDLVISVDTFVAHLAGALGRPVWLLLKQDADWRWGVGRADSAWYPTMRLFRQAAAGSWQAVLEEVRRCFDGWCTHTNKETHGALGHV